MQTTMKQKTKWSLVALALAFATAAMASSVFAQSSVEGAIRGTVINSGDGKPVADAIISISGPSLQGTREAVADGDGGR